MEQEHPVYAPAFFETYKQIDAVLGEVGKRLQGRDVLMLVSDHGFCSIRKEVFYNHWLAQQGWLKFHR
jgi:predicted AlkP superfamily phosphohydrolase/phosphomutase